MISDVHRGRHAGESFPKRLPTVAPGRRPHPGYPSPRPWTAWIWAQLVLASCLLPYLSPRPIRGVDVQPVAFAVSALALVYLAALRRCSVTRLDRAEAVALAAALLSAVYLDPFADSFSLADLRKSCAFLAGFVVYLSVRHLLPLMSPWTLFLVVCTTTAGWLVQWLAPAVYAPLSGTLMSRVSGLANNRGLNGLCPEPSFLAYTAILSILLSGSFRLRGARWPRWAHLVTLAMCLAAIVASRAAMGVALGALVICTTLIQRRRWGTVALLVVAASCTLDYGTQVNPSKNRAAAFVSSLASGPAAVLRDESLGMRLNGVVIGVSAMRTRPLGLGAYYPGEELNTALPVYARLRRQVFPRNVVRYIDSYPCRTRMNDVATTLYRMGWLGVVVFLAFLRAFGRRPDSLTLRALAGVGIAMSLPVALPPLYLMMAWARWSPSPPRPEQHRLAAGRARPHRLRIRKGSRVWPSRMARSTRSQAAPR